jgi:hypothetical protein
MFRELHGETPARQPQAGFAVLSGRETGPDKSSKTVGQKAGNRSKCLENQGIPYSLVTSTLCAGLRYAEIYVKCLSV